MAIEVPVNDYLESKCLYCGYGFHVIYKRIPNPNPLKQKPLKPIKTQEIVICDRQTKECKFTPLTHME